MVEKSLGFFSHRGRVCKTIITTNLRVYLTKEDKRERFDESYIDRLSVWDFLKRFTLDILQAMATYIERTVPYMKQVVKQFTKVEREEQILVFEERLNEMQRVSFAQELRGAN
ncbi:MAG: hypothetical protein ACFFCQ_12275 [Promethearchaeota archaeon]